MDVMFCIALPLFLAACILSVLRNMHIFQLNSYKAGTQLPWMKKNLSGYVSNIILTVITFIFAATEAGAAAIAVMAALLILALSNLPKKAKKPLKYTARVVRMLVTCGVFTAACVAVGFLLPPSWGIILISAFAVFSPLVVMLSNLINAPIEWAVRRRYTNEAKKLLASCPELTVIGVTGSYGKTSVKFTLGTLLRSKYNTLVTPENYNTPMGVVKTVRSSLRATHEMFVCEMGARYKGDIKELCRLVHPRFGVITSIGEQHLETFGSLETIVKTKFEIYPELPEDGILFVNGDCRVITDNIEKMRPLGKAAIVSYGTSEGCDYRAEVIKVSRFGTEFAITFPDGSRHSFATKLLGSHNVLNITGAVAVAASLGVTTDELIPAVKKLAPIPHRLQLIENGDLTIIDDAYNSNPAGCRAALEVLSLCDGQRILVTPGMVELGELEDECNREFGREAACCDHVILVGERQTAAIKAGLADAGYPQEKVTVVSGIGQALEAVRALPTENMKRKIVLLENDLPDNY